MRELLADSEALAVELEHLAAPNVPTADERGVIAGIRKADKPLREALDAV
jgi:hypothetical protein